MEWSEIGLSLSLSVSVNVRKMERKRERDGRDTGGLIWTKLFMMDCLRQV